MNGSMTSRIENHDNRRSYRENIRKFISTMSVKDLRHSNRNLCKIYESKLRRAQTELELLDLELDEKAGDIECSLNYSAQLSVLFSKLQGLQCEDESGKVGSFDDSLLEPSVKSTVNLVSDYLKTNDETLAPMSEFFTKLLAGGSKQKVSSYLTRFVDIIYSEEQTSPKCVENSQLSTPPDYDAIDWQSVLSVPSVSSPTEPPSFKQPKMNKKPAHKGSTASLNQAMGRKSNGTTSLNGHSSHEYQNKCVLCDAANHITIECTKYTKYQDRKDRFYKLYRCFYCSYPRSNCLCKDRSVVICQKCKKVGHFDVMCKNLFPEE